MTLPLSMASDLKLFALSAAIKKGGAIMALKKIGALWKKKDRRDVDYLSGTLNRF